MTPIEVIAEARKRTGITEPLHEMEMSDALRLMGEVYMIGVERGVAITKEAAATVASAN